MLDFEFPLSSSRYFFELNSIAERNCKECRPFAVSLALSHFIILMSVTLKKAVVILRFKQTCFVSTRLDITRSPVSVFARCLFLLAVCFLSLAGAASGVVNLSAYMVYDGCLLLSVTKPTHPTLCGGLDWCVCDFPLREGGIWDN